ncbi:MAG TPA: hypothetical protein VN045_06875 [Microbacteriaceae bacterium]|nr:hypothetical protein [Microbacteriaceae bacterium]
MRRVPIPFQRFCPLQGAANAETGLERLADVDACADAGHADADADARADADVHAVRADASACGRAGAEPARMNA